MLKPHKQHRNCQRKHYSKPRVDKGSRSKLDYYLVLVANISNNCIKFAYNLKIVLDNIVLELEKELRKS